MQISKDFTFEMAHKLREGFSYSTKCQNIHGHSYKATVMLGFKDSPCLNKDGMVIDFGLVSKEFKAIFDALDHSLMISKDDELFGVTRELLLNNSQKMCVTNFNPTSENLCIALLNLLNKQIGGIENVRVVSVSINETCTSKAQADFDDLRNLMKEPYEIAFIEGR